MSDAFPFKLLARSGYVVGCSTRAEHDELRARMRDGEMLSHRVLGTPGEFCFVLPTPDGGWTLSARVVVCGGANVR